MLLLNLRRRADGDTPAAGLVGFADAARAVDGRVGREVGALDVLHQLGHGDVRVVHHGQRAVDDLAEVVRGDVGRHADRDADAAVDQEVREAAGQHDRLLARVVEVGDEVHDILLNVGHHLIRNLREPRLGVTVSRRAVAVHVAEVAVAADERIAIGEGLRHAHHRAVHGAVAVGMIATQHITDRGRTLAERLVVGEIVLVHRVEDAALTRLHTVAHIGQRAAGDDAHRIFDKALTHLFLNVNGYDLLLREFDGFAQLYFFLTHVV